MPVATLWPSTNAGRPKRRLAPTRVCNSALSPALCRGLQSTIRQAEYQESTPGYLKEASTMCWLCRFTSGSKMYDTNRMCMLQPAIALILEAHSGAKQKRRTQTGVNQIETSGHRIGHLHFLGERHAALHIVPALVLLSGLDLFRPLRGTYRGPK